MIEVIFCSPFDVEGQGLIGPPGLVDRAVFYGDSDVVEDGAKVVERLA